MKIFKVGGFVRDTLLGRTPKDVDYVVVGATPEEMLAQGFSQVGAAFPVFLNKNGDEYALARKERKVGVGYNGFETTFDPSVTLEEDLFRRDLTINAMAMDDEGNVIDPYGGRADLEAGILRHVSEAFNEDPVRVLRVARFAARYGFEVHPDTLALMEKVAPELEHVTKERLWAEFEKGVMEANPTVMGDVLWKCNAFAKAPSLAPYKGFGIRMFSFLPKDTLATRFAILASSGFNDENYEAYKIPVELQRVHKAAHEHNMQLSAWPYTSVEDRMNTLVKLRAFNDTKLLEQIIEVIDVYRRFDGLNGYMALIKQFIFNDIRVAKTVDTEAIAKMAPTPKQIGPLIFAARCEALEQELFCRQQVLLFKK